MDDADYRALAEFRYQIRQFLHFSEEAARSEGLEPQQHQILLGVRGLGDGHGPTIGELADYLMVKHHSAVGLVDRLVQHGLVQRVHEDSDRRKVRVQLTAEGEAKLRRLSTAHRHELRNFGPRLVASL